MNDLDVYLKDVGRLQRSSRMSIEEEVRLFDATRYGDESERRDAMNKLVHCHLLMVVSISKEYSKKGAAVDELVSVGNEALVEAVAGFDTTRGFRFSTYAGKTIRNRMNEYLTHHSKFIHVPCHARTLTNKVKRGQLKYDELTRGGKRAVNDTMNARSFMVGEADFGLLEHYQGVFLDIDIRDFKTLTDIEIDVLSYYYGIYGNPMTLKEVGKKYDRCHERIRQIIEKALEKCRAELEAAGLELKDFATDAATLAGAETGE